MSVSYWQERAAYFAEQNAGLEFDPVPCPECGINDLPKDRHERCNDCRTDGWYCCDECGATYRRKHPLGGPLLPVAYTVTVEHSDGARLTPDRRIYRCPECASAWLARVNRQ